MLKLFKPTWTYKRFSNVTVDFLKQQGFRYVFTDLDNTLISLKNPNATEELQQWVQQLKDAGIRIILVSNNRGIRIQKVAEQLDLEYVFPSLKPLHKGFRAAIKLADIEKKNIVMIGDQVMTDILGANTFGLKTILVHPLDQHDGLGTKINRFFEGIVLTFLYGGKDTIRWEE